MKAFALLAAAAALVRVVGGAGLLLLLGSPRWAAAFWVMLNVKVRLLYARPSKPTEPPRDAQRRRP